MNGILNVLTLTLPWFFEPSLQTCARSRSKIGGKYDCFEVGLSYILSFPSYPIMETAEKLHDWSSGDELFVSALEEANRVISEFEKATISKFIMRRADKRFGAKGQCYCIKLNFQFNGKF